jgi:hypothetical protein
MTAEGWKELVVEAATDPVLLDMLARLLAEQDAAKARLCERFACTGRPWPDLVDDIYAVSRSGSSAGAS